MARGPDHIRQKEANMAIKIDVLNHVEQNTTTPHLFVPRSS